MRLPRSLMTGLFSTFFVRVAKLRGIGYYVTTIMKGQITKKTNLRVLSVSCLNLVPGARLQISKPMDEPPSASWRRRVNLELRYGMRD